MNKVSTLLKSSFKLKLYFLFKLPMALLAGLRIKNIDTGLCTVSVPFKYLNKNPFQSIYFAVLSMAAELSTALLVIQEISNYDKKVLMIITAMDAQFTRKAKSRIFFTCADGEKLTVAVNELINASEPKLISLKTIGKDKDGNTVAEFNFGWSLKLANL